VAGIARRAFPNEVERPPVILAVPGYLQVDDVEGRRLPGFEVLWPDDERERYKYRGWAAEAPKRFMAGAIVVGTIDQVLLSGLATSHAALRSTALLRQLLVVDEVHASDAYMTLLLEGVLDMHLRSGGHALLMSATLGSSARERLLACARGHRDPETVGEAIRCPYPALTDGDSWLPIPPSLEPKEVSHQLAPIASDYSSIAQHAVRAARAGARVLIIRNLVADCIKTQRAVEAAAHTMPELLFRCANVPAPHHSRYAREDRVALDRALETQFAEQAGRIVVATQTVEQSLDLDADLMITDLCPMDVLLQRVGRLHRHRRVRPQGFENPTLVVLTPAERNLATFVHKGPGRGPHGIGAVYEDLRIIESTWRLLEAHASLMIPQMCRTLVEQATHSDALGDLVASLDAAPWQAHAHWIREKGWGKGQLAQLALYDRSIPFSDLSNGFPDDRHPQTRLGEDDRLAVLADALRSPFGESIHRWTIPFWMARGVPADAEASLLAADDLLIRFQFGGAAYTYCRLGLHLEGE
jgi:CRISPR-associated endonuclease/helicase Cas3